MAQTSRVTGRATTIFPYDGKTVVGYHNTNVVMFDHETVTLNTGGWSTVTTKLRMNQAANQFGLGYQVYQKNWSWFVELADGTVLPFNDWEVTFKRVEVSK